MTISRQNPGRVLNTSLQNKAVMQAAAVNGSNVIIINKTKNEELYNKVGLHDCRHCRGSVSCGLLR